MDNATRSSQQEDHVPLWELLDSPTVDVYVGSEKIRWPLPEKLLSHHSNVLASAFASGQDGKDGRDSKKSSKTKKSYKLADEDSETFEFLVSYLYSSQLPAPSSEKSIGPLLDLYLLAQKLEMDKLSILVVDNVREWYHNSNTYPGLRRVQYIYANTKEDNEMREMMVSAVARQLTVGEKIPAHWASALQRNGQLAVDIIRAIQQWHIEERSIPDVREASSGRDRKTKGGFSAIEREGDSIETQGSQMTDSAIGLESRDDNDDDDDEHNDDDDDDDDGETPKKGYKSPNGKSEADQTLRGLKEVAAEANSKFSSPPSLPSPESPPPPPPLQPPRSPRLSLSHTLPSLHVSRTQRTKRPPEKLHSEQRKRRRKRSSFPYSPEFHIWPSPITEEEEENETETAALDTANQQDQYQHQTRLTSIMERAKFILLGFLWVIYLLFLLVQYVFPHLGNGVKSFKTNG